MKRFLLFFLDFFFPSRCVNCAQAVSYADSHVCPSCLGSVEGVENACPRCSGEMDNAGCTVCSDRQFYPEKNISVSPFTGVMKRMILAMKFEGKYAIASHLSRLANERLATEMIDFDIITYVPLSGKKEALRGFNQSKLIAQGIASKRGKPLQKLLAVKKKQGTQKEFGFHERFVNSIGSYSFASKVSLRDKRILIVDDVFTTGATLNECSRMLREQGAASVCTLALARTACRHI